MSKPYFMEQSSESMSFFLMKTSTQSHIFYRHSPPTQTYGLALMDFMGQYMFWMAAMTYTYKISPKNMIATMVAVVTSVTYTIGEINFRSFMRQS